MVLREPRCHIVELDPDDIASAWLEGRGELVAVAMAKIKYGVAHARRGAVGPDAVESHGGHGEGSVGAEAKRQHRRAHEIDRLGQRLAVEGQGSCIVPSLVAGKLGTEPDD